MDARNTEKDCLFILFIVNSDVIETIIKFRSITVVLH